MERSLVNESNGDFQQLSAGIIVLLRHLAIIINEAEGGRKMPIRPVAHESRRSTRVRLKVLIEVQGTAQPLSGEGETIVVNRHGALISTAVALRVGMRIQIRVILSDKRALADVAYIDPEQPRICGIGLVKPQNIWGLALPPDDWNEGDSDPAPE